MKEFIVRVSDTVAIQWHLEEPETPELVRCKDCTMRRTYFKFCPMLRESVKDDFFCGWGKPKEGNEK